MKLQPIQHKEPYIFYSIKSLQNVKLTNLSAFVKESEGYTIVTEYFGDYKTDISSKPMGKIKISLGTDLEQVGITKAISTSLAEQNIPCNIIAGFYHDYVYVPFHLITKAFSIIEKIDL